MHLIREQTRNLQDRIRQSRQHMQVESAGVEDQEGGDSRVNAYTSRKRIHRDPRTPKHEISGYRMLDKCSCFWIFCAIFYMVRVYCRHAEFGDHPVWFVSENANANAGKGESELTERK